MWIGAGLAITVGYKTHLWRTTTDTFEYSKFIIWLIGEQKPTNDLSIIFCISKTWSVASWLLFNLILTETWILNIFSLRYTRNLVDAGNGKFNLMIICWGEGHGSAIHDHSDCHCFMKMLKGELVESRYAWPETNHDTNNNEENECNSIWNKHGGNREDYSGSELQILGKTTMETNSVHYINGKLMSSSNQFHRQIETNTLPFTQIHLVYIALKMPVIRTVRFHCIYTVHHMIRARFLTKKRAKKHVAELNFTAYTVKRER